ncbi:MAG: DUF1080 domain-containing protein [Planctomycetales bacterium]|nr:DUF1080 domain-containing protein [Planctomycetales bacterium]
MRIVTAMALILSVSSGFSGLANSQESAGKTDSAIQNARERQRISESTAAEKGEDSERKSADKDGWKPMLPPKGMEGWKITDFGGQGKVEWDGKTLVLERGEPLTGIHSERKDFPKTDYEIRFEAQRVEGRDFFCGLTFPVGEGFCSLITGGWGGGVVGLSNIDGFDASENETSAYKEFENNHWYSFHVVVSQKEVVVTIDDKEFVRLEREGHEFSTRIEVSICEPLGYCVFGTKAAVRNWKWRPLANKVDAKDSTDSVER